MEAARALLADGDYWSSLELFLDAFESEQDGNLHGERACDEFHAALAGALEQLDLSADMGRFTALVAGVVRSRRRDAAALRMLAAKCLSAGVYPPAHCLLQAATKADPGCLLTRELLWRARDGLVRRWHFHMLNDFQRNSGYWEAISSAVGASPGCTVLDIGAGTGILSMMAVRAGASAVYACEVNETMADLSRDVIAANRMSDNVTVIRAHSSCLTVPEDIPRRVHLVITETVDAGLLGEGIVPSLRYAWQKLLLPRQRDESAGQNPVTSRVIPCGATVYVVAMECQEVRKQSRLLYDSVGGVDFSSVILEGSCKASTDSDVVRDRTGGCVLEREPYTCERLSCLRAGYRPLTEPCVALQFDFSNPEIPLPESRPRLRVVTGGRVDAVAMWFDLHLSPTLSVSTAPRGDGAWDQAVFPVHRDVTVAAGDAVLLHASCTVLLVRMEVEGVRRREEEETVGRVGGCGDEGCVDGHWDEVAGFSGNGGTESQEDGMDFSVPSSCVRRPPSAGERLRARDRPVFFVERGELSRLNDVAYAAAYREAITHALATVREADSSGSELEDNLSRMALCVGESTECGRGQDAARAEATLCSGNEEEGEEEEEEEVEVEGEEIEGGFADCIVLDMSAGLSVLGLVAAKNGAHYVQVGRAHPRYHNLLECVARSNRVDRCMSVRWLDVMATEPKWDVVVSDVVSPQGTLQDGIFEELSLIRSRHCHGDSVMVVAAVSVQAMAIASPSLRALTSVLGTVPTLGLDVARFMNQYQVSHCIDLDLGTLPHSVLAESCELLHVDLNSLGDDSLKVQHDVNVIVTTSGTLTAIAYWFILHLVGDVTIVTGPNAYTGSHWHQAAFLLPEDVEVCSGQRLTLQASLQDSCIGITLLPSLPHGSQTDQQC